MRVPKSWVLPVQPVLRRYISGAGSFEAPKMSPTGSSSADQNDPAAELEDDDVDALRQRILEHALRHVRSDGWSREAIASAVEDLKYVGVIHRVYYGLNQSC